VALIRFRSFQIKQQFTNFTCTFSNMSIISASAKRWRGGVEWSGVLETPNWSGVLQTPNWSRVLIEHMNRGVFQSPVSTIVPSCTWSSSVPCCYGMCYKVEWSGVESWSEAMEWKFGVVEWSEILESFPDQVLITF
jgi:hypothetical protein